MELTPVFVVGFLVLGTYKLFELFVRKSERLAIIEKLVAFSGDKVFSGSIKLPDISFGSDSGSWALRVALLLIGVGLGCLLGFFTQYYYFGDSPDWHIRQLAGIIYLAYIAIFGGAGLLVAYLIEMHHKSPYANKSAEGLTK
ncbi:hypothetical protein AGMMS4957_02010 [Bacteroidia bacterium]|nr:hypothetical protein AGMMS4957_02010 [Bacteroidia bacterium]